MKTNILGLRPVYFLAVFFSEEEPVGESYVKQFRLFSVQSYKVQPLAIAVPPTKEGPWVPIFPRISTSLLYRQ